MIIDRTASELEEKIVQTLVRCGPQDALGLSRAVGVYLTGDSADWEFFALLAHLEEKKVVESYPTSEEIPGFNVDEGSFPYVSRVYGIRTIPSRNSPFGRWLRKYLHL
jgi:hypothetical protein